MIKLCDLIKSHVHDKPLEKQEQCETHGSYLSRCYFGNAWTRCRPCVEAEDAKELAEAQAKASAEKQCAWEKKLGFSGIPERFKNKTIKDYVTQNKGQLKAKEFAASYADNFIDALKTGRSAIFVGRPGTGKTHLAIGICLIAMQSHKKTAMFTSMFRLMRRVKDAYRKDSAESQSSVIAAFAGADLLVLDEVGQQFGTDAEKLILFDLLNERYENRKPTIFLANIPLDDYIDNGVTKPGIKSFLGERVMDRLREGGGNIIPFEWESARGRIF